MIRTVLGILSVGGLFAAHAAAQVPVSVASGVGGFGGGTRPGTPSLSAPVDPQFFHYGHRYGYGGPGVGGGYHPGYGYGYGYGSGYGGGYYGGYYPSYYGGGYYSSPYAAVPQPTIVVIAAPANPVPPAPPERRVLSGDLPARLTLVFPAPAEVWLDGVKADGEPAVERTLTSPTLRPGQAFTFRVRARWEADGQAFEYAREVTLGGGDNSKLHVISGTAVGAK